MVQNDNPLELKVPFFQPDHVDLRQYSVFKHSIVTVTIKASRTWSFLINIQVCFSPKIRTAFPLFQKDEFEARYHFHEYITVFKRSKVGQVCLDADDKWFKVWKVCQKDAGSAHCKVKSSDHIIINAFKTDGRSSCFGLWFHLKGNQSLH